MTTPLINIEVEENTDYNLQITYVDPSTNLPIDITNYTAEIVVERNIGDIGEIALFSTDNGDIVLTGAGGLLTITIPAVTTLGMGQSIGFYNLFITSSLGLGARTKICKGFFTTTASVMVI